MDPRIIALLAVGGILLFGLGIAFVIRRLSAREFGEGQPAAHQPSTGCGGNCGCNCAPPPTQQCVGAVRCQPPHTVPVAIDGLSCDPNDPNHVYALHLQEVVNGMNQQAAERQREAAIERFHAATSSMVADDPPSIPSGSIA